MRSPQRPQMSKPCKQRRSFPRRRTPCAGMRLSVVTQNTLVGLIADPVDVAGMRLGNQHSPLLPGHKLLPGMTVEVFSATPATEHEGTGIAGIMQHVEHAPMGQLTPEELAFVNTEADAAWKAYALALERLHRGICRAGAFEALEQQAQRRLRLTIGVQNNVVCVDNNLLLPKAEVFGD